MGEEEERRRGGRGKEDRAGREVWRRGGSEKEWPTPPSSVHPTVWHTHSAAPPYPVHTAIYTHAPTWLTSERPSREARKQAVLATPAILIWGARRGWGARGLVRRWACVVVLRSFAGMVRRGHLPRLLILNPSPPPAALPKPPKITPHTVTTPPPLPQLLLPHNPPLLLTACRPHANTLSSPPRTSSPFLQTHNPPPPGSPCRATVSLRD